MENKILSAAIHSREFFDDLEIRGLPKEFSDKSKIIWDSIKEFYTNDGQVKQADKEIIFSRISRRYPKHKEIFEQIAQHLNGAISPENLRREIIDFKLAKIRDELIGHLAQAKDVDVIKTWEKYYELAEGMLPAVEKLKLGKVYKNISSDEFIDRTSAENRIKLLPKELNQMLDGGVLRKHHILVFGRPDMGKSLFMLNLSRGFLLQGLRVLYCGNEDPPEDMIPRLMWSITGLDKFEMLENREMVNQKLQKSGFSDNFLFAELIPGTLRELKELVGDEKPDVLIVDQVKNIFTGEKSNHVLALEKACRGVREIGKEFNILPISVTQAGDSAEGKSILGMGDVDWSNTGIPGTVDLMIGLGATNDMLETDHRMLSYPKNKVSLTRDPIRVRFDRRLTRVE